MDINEYRGEFLERIRFQAEHNSSDAQSQFLDTILEKLEECGELNDPYPYECNMYGTRGRKLAFDAYAYDEADSSIVLLISDFYNDENKVSLSNQRIEDLSKAMRNFIIEAYSGEIRKYCDDSDFIIDIAKEFKRRIGKSKYDTEILKFKFFLVTNAEMSERVKTLKQEELLERPVELNVWDLGRFYQQETSQISEVITIDTAKYNLPEGIQCLKANIADYGDYDAYLAIVPGKFLADIYLDKGSRLLEGNVRSFLSARGKVNSKIRETINSTAKRHNFFIYNNGIAVVANRIQLSKDGTRLLSFEDFQIINGGQTTASLANSFIKKESDLKDIFVPMKLTVLNMAEEKSEEEQDKYNEMTKEISKCANSQNAVSEADFFSTHPFHVQMEKMSQKYPAPPVDGKPYQTIWYYERSRGRWEQEQMKMTPAQRDKFKRIHPSNQVIKKEKLAKCLNAVFMNPHSVSAGSANNMKAFAGIVDDIWAKSQDNINEFFFHKAVASVIMFDTVDTMINKSEWYQKGGNKAMVTPYTISKIISMVPKGKDIDWEYIWKRQALPDSIVRQVEIVSQIADGFPNNSGGMIVREYARKVDTWKKFRDECDIEATEDFLDSLISTVENKEAEKSAKRAHKFNSDIELSVQMFSLGYQYWMRVYKDLESNRLVPVGDCEFVKSIAGYIQRYSLPSAAQCKRMKKIIDKAEDAGYIMPEK